MSTSCCISVIIFSFSCELTRSLSEDCLSSILETYPRVRVMTEAASTMEVRLSFILPTVSPSSLVLIWYKCIDMAQLDTVREAFHCLSLNPPLHEVIAGYQLLPASRGCSLCLCLRLVLGGTVGVNPPASLPVNACPAPAWPTEASYWLLVASPSSNRRCDWLPLPEPMSCYMMSPAAGRASICKDIFEETLTFQTVLHCTYCICLP